MTHERTALDKQNSFHVFVLGLGVRGGTITTHFEASSFQLLLLMLSGCLL
jgi:hypothetical protein